MKKPPAHTEKNARMGTRDGATLDVSHEFLTLWTQVLETTPREVREKVARLADGMADALAEVFYTRLLEHDHARLFLDNDIVSTRLHASMARWVRTLFSTLDVAGIPSAIAQQILVGTVHARIHLPAELMQMGFHVIARELRRHCTEAFPDPVERFDAMAYLMDIFHITDSLMLSSFVRDLQSQVRKEEAYRLISLEHDVALERERQRAALSEWVNQFLISIRLRSRAGSAGTLGASEFGLWMLHKAPVFFTGVPDLEHVFDVIRTVDEQYVPQLTGPVVDPDTAERLVTDLERRIEFIRYLVNDLFARLNKVTLGRDTVTRLLNQRYLPTILGMEIQGHAAQQKPFAVTLVRIDRLGKLIPVDDRDGRDILMQQLSVAVVESVRAGDHAFRYDDDEFLILTVEVDPARAKGMAEELRLRIRALEFHLRSHIARRVTVSVGIAHYDGHPDYQYLLQRAEAAVTRAAQEGGDRVVAV